MRKAYQYRYVKNDIYPDTLTPGKIVSGSAFSERMPVYQIGIQCLPGTKFFLNESDDPIIIGATGIYELDLHEKTAITAINFHPESIQTLLEAMKTGSGYLIVDIVYEEEEK